MAHYAFINNKNIVTEVIVGKDENDLDDLPEEFSSWESYYLSLRPQSTACKRTSYNTRGNQHLNSGTPFRANYAGRGYIYDESNDVFYPPKPFESWILNSNWVWEAPIPYPTDGNNYIWNENLYVGDNTLGWELINY